jgi:hypothetical protein
MTFLKFTTRVLPFVGAALLLLTTAAPAQAHRVRGVSARLSGAGYVIEQRYGDVYTDFLAVRNRNRDGVRLRCTVVAWSEWVSSDGTGIEHYQTTAKIRARVRARTLKLKDFAVFIPHPEKWDYDLGLVPWYDQVAEGGSVPHCH